MLRRVARTCLQTTSSRAFTARVELLPHTSSSYSTSPQPSEDASAAQSRVNNVANALKDTKPADNNLLSPVHIPEDPHGVIKERHPATSILANSAIVIQRELEMMNIMMGLEQAVSTALPFPSLSNNLTEQVRNSRPPRQPHRLHGRARARNRNRKHDEAAIPNHTPALHNPHLRPEHERSPPLPPALHLDLFPNQSIRPSRSLLLQPLLQHIP